MTARRINKEFQDFLQRAPPGATVVQLESGSDWFRAIAADLPAGACAAWILHFTCPPTWLVHGDEKPSPYAGLRLSFQIAFPHDYPFKPFTLKSLARGRARDRVDRLYHPVRSEGSAAPLFGGCHAGGRLRDGWSPARTVASVVSETIWLCFSDFERAVPPEALERFHASLDPPAPAATAYDAAVLSAAAGAEESAVAAAAGESEEAAGEGARMTAAGAGAGSPLHPPAAPPVTVVIKALTGRVHEIPISPDAPFEELQRLLAVATGCSPEQQRLVRRGAGAVIASRPGQPIRELGLTGCGTVEQPDLHLVLGLECAGCGLDKPVATLLHRDYAAFFARAREAALATGAVADVGGRGEGERVATGEGERAASSAGAAGGAGAIDVEDATSALRRLRV
jgi:ubiquitin-protein ligase